MQKWEYLLLEVQFAKDGEGGIVYSNRVVVFNNFNKDKGKTLNLFDYFTNLGKDGWELNETN